MRAFQHLTVATEPVSAALRPPRLPRKTEVLASQGVCNRGSGIRASHSRCWHLQWWPNYDVSALDINPWVLASQDLLGLITQVLCGDQGRVLGKPCFQLLRFKALFLLCIIFKAWVNAQGFQQHECQPQPPQDSQQGSLLQRRPRKLNVLPKEIKHIRRSSLNTNLLSQYRVFEMC